MTNHDFETAPTTEYAPCEAPTIRLCSRDTEMDLTEPLHDPADDEMTNPGQPYNSRLR